MTNSTAQHEMEGDELITFPALQAAADAMARRGKIRKGGIKILIREVIERWDKAMPSPGEEFRTDESVREQHFLESLPQDEWVFLTGGWIRRMAIDVRDPAPSPAWHQSGGACVAAQP